LTAIDDRPKLDETYARATRSSDLTPSAEHRTDADILLAAGYAAQKNRHGMVALMAYRMKITGDRASKGEIVELLVDMIAHKVSRRKLLMEPIPGTPHLSANYCKACAGGGKRPIPDQGARFNQHAEWLAAELDHMLTFIVGDMARMLRPSLDLKVKE
jgi:hypothetical protein